VLGGEGFEGDAVAEGLELGDGSLTLAIGVAPGEVVATQVLVVAVVGEQVPGNDQDRVPDRDGRLLLADASGQPPVLGRQVGVAAAGGCPGAPG
jgi:hypothetical protein